MLRLFVYIVFVYTILVYTVFVYTIVDVTVPTDHVGGGEVDLGGPSQGLCPSKGRVGSLRLLEEDRPSHTCSRSGPRAC